MSVESKNTLKAQNQSSFPNNTTGYITPEILRDFNVNIIDSLVDEISFGAYTASITAFSSSVDIRLDSLEAFSSSLDTTFATDAQLNASSSTLQANINTKLNTASFDSFTASYYVDSASVDSRLDSSLVTASVSQSTITFTKGDGSTFNITVADISGSGGTVNTGSLLLTASFDNGTRNLTFTKGDNTTFNVNIPDVSGSTIDTASFATTGSNSFRGQQIVSSSVLIVTSGSGDIESLELLPYLSSSTYNGYRDLTTVARDRTLQSSVGGASPIYSASAVNPVNIIFGQTIPTATAQGTISGSNNILLTTRLNATTGSEGFSANFAYITSWPLINNPFLGNTVRSANSFINSATTINLQNNGISSSTALGYPNFNRADAVTINNSGINATTVVTPSGSAITLQSNILYGGPHTFISPRVDSWTGAEYALNSSSLLSVTNNIFNGQVTVTDRNSVRAGGNNTAVQNNLFGGVSMEVVTPVSGTNSTGHVFNTIAYGNGLIVTGSMASQGGGSGVFGRFNANDGIRNALQQNVFIVGTGTSNSIRKTGFLIDSGSNIYAEGSLNVSGSTALTGSLIHSGSLSITGSGGIILTGSLQLTGSNLVINSAGTLIYNDKTVIQFYPSVNSNTESFSRFTKDGISLFQYQNQGHVFGFRYTADQLNEYSGSQFKTALTNDGVAYDDYVSYLSASISGSGGSIPGIQLTDGKAIYQTKTLLQKNRAYFDQDVIIAGQGVATALTVTGSVNITGSLSVNGTSLGAQKNYASYYTTTQQSGSFLTSLTEEAVVGFQNVSGSYVRAVNGGVYQVTVNAALNSAGTSGTSTISLYKTGSQITGTTYGVYFTNAASDASITSTAIISLNANEYVEVGLGMVDTDKVTSARISVIQIS